jgi:hypothetical protein
MFETLAVFHFARSSLKTDECSNVCEYHGRNAPKRRSKAPLLRQGARGMLLRSKQAQPQQAKAAAELNTCTQTQHQLLECSRRRLV